jgi:ComEC/Rec2-related protein
MKQKYFSFLFVISLLLTYSLVFSYSYFFSVLLIPLFFVYREKIFLSLLIIIFIAQTSFEKENFSHSLQRLGMEYQGELKIINTFYGQKKAFAKTDDGSLVFVSFKDSIKRNDVFDTKGSFVKIKADRNPASFNQDFFAFQNRVYVELLLSDFKFIRNEKDLYSSVQNYMYNLSKDHSIWFRSILFASLLGDKSFMGSEQAQLFSKSGLSHFFALSGLHVGLLIFIIFAFLKQFIKSFKIRIVIILSFLVLYIIVVGLKAPIFRASLMAILLLYALYFEKYKSIYHILWVTAIINLCIFPHDTFSLSFYLSYFVFFSIIYISDKSELFLQNFSQVSNCLFLPNFYHFHIARRDGLSIAKAISS